VRDLGVDAAFPISDLSKELPRLVEGYRKIYFGAGRDPEADRTIFAQIASTRAQARRLGTWPTDVCDPAPILGEIRLRKSASELELMRRAASVTAEGHLAAMRTIRPGMTETQVQGVVERVFRLRGSERLGYPSIVGAGRNATILHYVENNQTVADGDLVLVDAGCEFGGYTADITRTFPANGRWTPEQRALYEVVLDAQLRAIALCREGVPFTAPHEEAVRALTEGLVKLGLLSGDRDALIASGAYTRFYMHRTSHWLGLDVHDVGAYVAGDAQRPLVAGAVLTVEPGLYIAEDEETVDPRWRGIGIRIEDDVLVGAGPPRFSPPASRRIRTRSPPSVRSACRCPRGDDARQMTRT
jgi:Xaa-Pro aminopeptidase